MKNALLESPSVNAIAALPSCPVAESRNALRSVFVGSLYRVDGKLYVMTDEEQVFDTETGEQVLDSETANRVFDLHGEGIRIADEIRNRAKALAKGDPLMEEMLRLHFALTGLSKDSLFPEASLT